MVSTQITVTPRYQRIHVYHCVKLEGDLTFSSCIFALHVTSVVNLTIRQDVDKPDDRNIGKRPRPRAKRRPTFKENAPNHTFTHRYLLTESGF